MGTLLTHPTPLHPSPSLPPKALSTQSVLISSSWRIWPEVWPRGDQSAQWQAEQTSQSIWLPTLSQSHPSASHLPLLKGIQVWFPPSPAASLEKRQRLLPSPGLFLLLQKVRIMPAAQPILPISQVRTRLQLGWSRAGLGNQDSLCS